MSPKGLSILKKLQGLSLRRVVIISTILLIVVASFLVTAEQEKVTLKYEEYSMGTLEETKTITLYSYGSGWYRSPLRRGESVNEVDQLKGILTDKDAALNNSEWLGSYDEKRKYEREIRKRYEKIEDANVSESNLTKKKLRERLRSPYGIRTPYGYGFESTGSQDEHDEGCTIEFTHNSILYKVNSANKYCHNDAWRVEAEGESYIIASERVTEIFLNITNAYE